MSMPINTLAHLLSPWIILSKQHDCPIKNLCRDSRQVVAGDVFIVVVDDKKLQQMYITQALENNAAAIVTQGQEFHSKLLTSPHGNTIPWITFPNLAKELGYIACRFYENKRDNFTMGGVTGTNGKTSISHYIAQILQQQNIPCGIIGTLGNGFPEKLLSSVYTTPDTITTHQVLAQLRAQGAQHIMMEVSSHALEQHRVIGVDFSSAIFTNLTRDHLDFHGSMEAYAAAKSKLFTDFPLLNAIINLDDPFSRELIQKIPATTTVWGYSMQEHADLLPLAQQIIATDIQFSNDGMQAHINSPWGTGVLKTYLLGQFNISNLLAVLAYLCLQKIDFSQVLTAIAALRTVPGRMQAFRVKNKPLTVVDYSHTPDSLMKALSELRHHAQGEIWCVVGCGGDRDRGKRPIMGHIAQTNADHVIFTDDNPRHENPQQIMSDILSGITDNTHIQVEHERAKAIQQAITQASANDIVVIAGKGHEDYQIIGDVRHHFSDIELVNSLLASEF